jgi:acyl-coenzyme A thioesterase PaaI-like protein
MKEKITRKQPNSKKCFVCGVDNNFGLKSSFYEMESKKLVGVFTPEDEHQGYPGRLHGGIASAILDETMGRALMIDEENIWGVTIDLSLRFKKPLPLNEEIKVIAWVTSNSSRLYEAAAEIRLTNGEIAMTAKGKYMKLPLEKITQADDLIDNWKVVYSENEPMEIEI